MTDFAQPNLIGIAWQALYSKVCMTKFDKPWMSYLIMTKLQPTQTYLRFTWKFFVTTHADIGRKKKITIGCAWKKCKPIASDRPVNGLLSILITRRWLYVLKHCTWTIINYKRTGAPSLIWNSATDMIAQDRHVGLLSTGQPDQVIG